MNFLRSLSGWALAVAAAISIPLTSLALADEALYQDCFGRSVTNITNHIIAQCRTDMANRISDAGGKISDSLASEEQTCEATANIHAAKKAAAECIAVRNQPAVGSLK
jgi:hypothetical protein